MASRNTIRLSAAYALALLLAGVTAGCATTGQYGQTPRLVTDSNGMTMYRFDKDRRGARESACYDACAANWPPAPASEASGGKFGSLTRSDGTTQLTYDGWPVYYYAGDSAPGDRKGDNIGGVWHAVEWPRMSGSGDQSDVIGGGGY